MSEIKTLDVDVDILGSLDVDVDFGKTIVKTIGSDLYSGPFEFYPSGEVQVVPIGGKTSTKDVIFKAVQSGQAGTPVASKGTVSNHSLTVTPQVSNTEGYISTETKNGTPVTVTASELVSGSQTITENGSYDVTNLSGVDISIEPDLQTKSVNPSEESQTVTYDDDYDGLSSVSVGAIPSSYIGSAVNRRSSSDLTSSGATVNVPSGYFAENAFKAVQSGQAGTPVASKGTVSNHSIAVTPSVSNSEGYISGGTLTGNAIAVSASELVSGTKEVSITDNGTTIEDVTNYANAAITTNVVNQDYLDSLTALGVTEDLSDSIEALTTYANSVTGESDTTLSDAVASLADGYGQGGGGVKYSRYELTGDTTFKNLIDTIQYAPQDTQNCMLFFRASGTVAPTTGSYTMNNYIFVIENGTVKGWNAYANGKVAPNSVIEFPRTLQSFNDLMIINGILTTNSTSTNCLGTTGDVVTIAEYPGNLALSLSKINGGTL